MVMLPVAAQVPLIQVPEPVSATAPMRVTPAPSAGEMA